LDSDESNRCVFISQDTAKDAGTLAEKSRIATCSKQYLESLGNGHAEKFKELVDIWNVNSEKAFSWLKRCDFRTESIASIDNTLIAFSDLYFVKASNSAFEILRDFLEIRFNQDITTEGVRNWFRSEGKLTIKDWALDSTLRERLSDETTSYLATYIPFGAGGSTISRLEAGRLVDLVGNPTGPDVVLLTGVAGSGKSGVIREFIKQLDELSIPHLAFRIDQHLDCTSPTTLGKAVTGREESPVSTLKGLGPERTSVLIVDQVDAVSEVSGRNGVVKQTVLRLVDHVRNFGSIKLIIACRTFDLESDARLKALKEARGVAHVDVALLEWQSDVEPLLASKSINVALFSEKQRSLLRLPLNLALFLETCDHAEPLFASRNDLFARLLEKKGRSIRADRQLTWELIAPLSELAEWMSMQQKLDAPEDTLAKFGGALDILTSEGLIVRSRRQINFFHESFFDYVYARKFASRQQSLCSLLESSEQHLFRRTQARQILETLRQTDVSRYIRELRTLLSSEAIRYHVKVAIAQWLGSLSDPFNEEKVIILALPAKPAGPFAPLLRYAFFSATGWFDLLLQDGWISESLSGKEPERRETLFWWLGTVAGKRPAEIAALLDNWWNGDPERGLKLVEWFGLAKRDKADAALTNLCSRALRSAAGDLFGISRRVLD
jgi:23S rRNA maturation mini-RNase III